MFVISLPSEGHVGLIQQARGLLKRVRCNGTTRFRNCPGSIIVRLICVVCAIQCTINFIIRKSRAFHFQIGRCRSSVNSCPCISTFIFMSAYRFITKRTIKILQLIYRILSYLIFCKGCARSPIRVPSVR